MLKVNYRTATPLSSVQIRLVPVWTKTPSGSRSRGRAFLSDADFRVGRFHVDQQLPVHVFVMVGIALDIGVRKVYKLQIVEGVVPDFGVGRDGLQGKADVLRHPDLDGAVGGLDIEGAAHHGLLPVLHGRKVGGVVLDAGVGGFEGKVLDVDVVGFDFGVGGLEVGVYGGHFVEEDFCVFVGNGQILNQGSRHTAQDFHMPNHFGVVMQADVAGAVVVKMHDALGAARIVLALQLNTMAVVAPHGHVGVFAGEDKALDIADDGL